jgi:pimeloyl-ACP methyl ester carboxylesterase
VIGIGLIGATCVAADPSPMRVVSMPAPRVAVNTPQTWLLHLPGIAGRRWVDDQLVFGLRDGGYDGALDVYDWTGEDPGLPSLFAYKRNQAEAQKVADLITDHVHKNPGDRIILTGHSGGTGIAVWALEKLPADVKIDEVILLASALSPTYDLSKALSHVTGHCYSFCSENDVLVLGAGTKMFGTIDGVKTEAAGHFGFIQPAAADPLQYAKLIQKPYDKSYLQYHNVGDHIGCMVRPFTHAIVAPLVAPTAADAGDDKHQAKAKTSEAAPIQTANGHDSKSQSGQPR